MLSGYLNLIELAPEGTGKADVFGYVRRLRAVIERRGDESCKSDKGRSRRR